MRRVVCIPKINDWWRRLANCVTESGYLLQNEWPVYIFDALLMAIVLGICQEWYFGSMVARGNLDVEMSSEM
jgi:hypothetical protein